MEQVSLPQQANRHFLDAVVDLSAEREIEVSEDVYSQCGMKLIARGTRVNASLYERVVNHKLKRPIETSLVARDGVDTHALREEAERLVEEQPLLQRLCAWSLGRVTPMGMLERMQFSPQATTLMAVSEKRSPGCRQHNITVSLIAMGLANAHRYNDPHLLASIGQAGIFHDLGEVYVDPAFFEPGHSISPREWMTFSAHPIVGAALAREVAGLDARAQTAILEHHERMDGFGYPRALRGERVSVEGRLLGLAESLSALLDKDCARTRIDIALKIMPGEFEPAMVSLIGELLRDVGAPPTLPRMDADHTSREIHDVFARIEAALDAHDVLMAHVGRLSLSARVALEDVFDRFVRVQRAFASTGVDGLEAVSPKLDEGELIETHFEAHCVLDEISWRLTKLSRELAQKCLGLPQEESSELMLMANALVGFPRT